MYQHIFRLAESYVTPDDLNIPKGSPDSITATVLTVVFAVAGSIAVLIIVIAGLRLVLSMGNPEALNKSRNAVIYAVIGLIVCVAGFTIVQFVTGRL